MVPDYAVQISLVLAVAALFYVLLIRPQVARMARHRALLSDIAAGDRVVIAGGLVGTITALQTDGLAVVELSSGVTVAALRSSIESRFPA
jgi:preprotein translocase subunit YajC